MSGDLFHEDLDTFTETGRFFVALTDRLKDPAVAEVLAGEMDATRLAHRLLVPVPPGLKGVSVEMLEEGHEFRPEADQTTVVIQYPPVETSAPPEGELRFSKCFSVCKTVNGAKVCATVCASLDIGTDGVHGSIEAKVSVAF